MRLIEKDNSQDFAFTANCLINCRFRRTINHRVTDSSFRANTVTNRFAEMDPADEPSDPSGVDYSTVNRPRKAKLAVLQQREKDKNKEEDAEEDGYSSDSTSSSSREDHRTRIGTTKSRKQFVKEIKKRKKRRPNNSSDEDYGDFVQIAGTEKNVFIYT